MTAELYELIDLGAGWRMPIRVRWVNSANAEVTTAEIPLLKIQSAAIVARLNAACTHWMNGKWWIPKLSLEKIAIKSNESDPERVVQWHQPEPESTDVQADFVHAYCRQRFTPHLLKNPEVFAAVWASMQKFMLQWMVGEGRSIDFGFGRLDAFPVRANWKNAIIGRIFKNRKYQDHYTHAQYDFFLTCLLKNSEMVTAYDLETHTMRWSVEFTPNRQFHAAALTRENERKNNHRWKANYLGQILQALREPDVIKRLHENVIAYSKETDFPYAIFPDGSSIRHPPKGFQPTRSTVAWYQVNLVTRAAVQGHEGSALVPEDASVPSVQHLQSQPEDVRNTGGEMDAARQD